MTIWDIYAPFYDGVEWRIKTYRQMIDKVCEIVPSGADVLELAGGTGNISLAVSHKAKSVLCSDISEKMLKVAKRKAKKQNASNISFENVNIFETGKKNHSFDVVIASQVFHLIDKPEKACEEIKRITKDMAIIPVPLLKNGTEFGKAWTVLFRVLGIKPKYTFTKETCKAYLEQIGFGNCEYYMIEGGISLCVAVWRKR